MTLSDKLFSFEGRLRRRDWWLLSILLFVFQLIVTVVAAFALIGPQEALFESRGLNSHIPSPLNVLTIGIELLLVWPSLAVMVKRRHDRDDSGAVFVVLYFLGLALTYLPATLLGGGVAALAMLGLATGAVSLVIGLWFLIAMGFLEGTPGSNRFGPSPKPPVLENAWA
jgi:uncharacterized membrane protein YhaH (DUF805 family)